MTIHNKILIVIAGPTAAGKTKVAIELARQYSTEIISFDSRQFYREMNIGTAKPSEEELKQATHHFIGHLSARDNYTAGNFATDADFLLNRLFERHDIVITVGGSGLFMRAWLEGLDEFPKTDKQVREQLNKLFENEGIQYLQELLKEKDPAYYNEVDKNNPRRLIRALEVTLSSGSPYSSFRARNRKHLPYQVIKIGLDVPREELYKRINNRTDEMIKAGLVEEAKSLYPLKHLNPLKTVGYTELFDYFDGIYSLQQAIENIKQNSRNYAKRQMTWFRKEELMNWINSLEASDTIDKINSIINVQRP